MKRHKPSQWELDPMIGTVIIIILIVLASLIR